MGTHSFHHDAAELLRATLISVARDRGSGLKVFSSLGSCQGSSVDTELEHLSLCLFRACRPCPEEVVLPTHEALNSEVQLPSA